MPLTHEDGDALSQSGAERLVFEIELGFLNVSQSIKLGVNRCSEAMQLRKDEPHPMPSFLAHAKLLQGSVIGADLSFEKKLRLEFG